MIQEEAKATTARLNETAFQASSGWLEKWEIRYNIRQMNVASKEGDINEETIAR